MGSGKSLKNKNCDVCGRFFRPHPRLGERQKSCGLPECLKARKRANQCTWVEHNPKYFQGRSEQTKQWRKKNPGYQRAWRAKRREIQDSILPKSRVTTLRLVVPAEVFKGEIQDSIMLVRRCGCESWVAGVPG